jgi:hypothetical protein
VDFHGDCFDSKGETEGGGGVGAIFERGSGEGTARFGGVGGEPVKHDVMAHDAPIRRRWRHQFPKEVDNS